MIIENKEFRIQDDAETRYTNVNTEDVPSLPKTIHIQCRNIATRNASTGPWSSVVVVNIDSSGKSKMKTFTGHKFSVGQLRHVLDTIGSLI